MVGHALNIGLNEVDPAAYGGWDGKLLGCINDANSMAGLAMAKGFSTFTKLTNSDATSYAIIGEIGQLANNALAGDICLITFSGHGGQVWDANSEEEDSQDETWVAYDRQIVDDELYQMWSQFRSGVRIVVCSDSCHSGTVAKDFLTQSVRKTLAEHAQKLPKGQTAGINVIQGAAKAIPSDVQLDDNKRRRETYKYVQVLSGAKTDANIRASVLLLSGCQDSQMSYDGPTNGQFTGTLLQTWANGSFQGSYTAFHQAIMYQMPPDQVPNLYTINMDSAFLGQRPFTV